MKSPWNPPKRSGWNSPHFWPSFSQASTSARSVLRSMARSSCSAGRQAWPRCACCARAALQVTRSQWVPRVSWEVVGWIFWYPMEIFWRYVDGYFLMDILMDILWQNRWISPLNGHFEIYFDGYVIFHGSLMDLWMDHLMDILMDIWRGWIDLMVNGDLMNIVMDIEWLMDVWLMYGSFDGWILTSTGYLMVI